MFLPALGYANTEYEWKQQLIRLKQWSAYILIDAICEVIVEALDTSLKVIRGLTQTDGL